MDKVKSNKLRGDYVYDFLKTYNREVAFYNRRHKDNVDQLEWEPTIKQLNKMSKEQETMCATAIKKAWIEYYKTLEKELHPIIEDILGIDTFRDMD